MRIVCGVPQGLNTGPMLSLMWVNDFPLSSIFF